MQTLNLEMNISLQMCRKTYFGIVLLFLHPAVKKKLFNLLRTRWDENICIFFLTGNVSGINECHITLSVYAVKNTFKICICKLMFSYGLEWKSAHVMADTVADKYLFC